MKVVRFLERKEVIKFFGVALLLAPFINFALHVMVLKFQSQVAWSQFQFMSVIQHTNFVSFMLALCSLTIGGIMLTGSQKAWKFVLILIGSHLMLQILNVGDKAWKGPLAWPSFLLNTGLFFFIFDQLVWKVKADNLVVTEPLVTTPLPNATEALKAVINLKSYRKILFSFGSKEPWGELKTLSSEMLTVKSFSEPPDNIDGQIVQINFSKEAVVEIQFFKKENDMYFFKPLNMNKEKVTNLNNWLRKIAV